MFILITNLQMEDEASLRRNTVLVTEVPTRSPLNVRETTTAAANSLAAGTPGGNHQISNDGRRRQGAGTSSNDGGSQRPLQISHQTTVNGDNAGPSHQDNSSGCSSALSSLESIKSNSGGGGASNQKVREKSP